jgi:hypothetical protein
MNGVEGAVFVQRLRTEKQTGNVASGQNGCARTTESRQFKEHVTVARNDLTRDKFLSHLCSKPYFLVLKHFMYFTVYNCMKNENFE